MSSIIKAERLVVDKNYTLVGEVDLLIEEDVVEETVLEPSLTVEEDVIEEITEPDPDPQEQVNELREEAERILRETEDMVVEILERARGEAQVIMTNAREDAQAIITDAQDEAEKMKIVAVEQGHREGLQLAFREIEEQRKKAQQENEELINSGHRERASIIRTAEPDIVNLSVAIAEKILSQQIKAEPAVILNIVKEALKLAGEADNVRVMVHPDDADTVKYFAPQLIEPDQNIGDLQVDSDKRIERGGCLVETEKGIIDARLQTRRFNVEGAVLEGVTHA